MSNKRISKIIPTVLIIISFLIIAIFDSWRLRVLFGLALFIAFPLVTLYVALNPKIRLTKYDPKEMPKERFILRHLGIAVRVGMVLFAVSSAIYLTTPYVKSVAGLVSKERDLDVVRGVVTHSRGAFPGSLGKRDFKVAGCSRKISLIFPIGKRVYVGKEYEFLMLPDTDFAVDARKVNDQ